MAIQPIGSIDLQIAELEARGIEGESQRLRGLGGDVGGSIQGALQSAEVLQRQAIDEQMNKEAKALLMSGAEGINQYSDELGFDQRSKQMFNQMAQNVRNPEDFSKIYQMQKAKADKDLASQKRIEQLGKIQPLLEEYKQSNDPKIAEQIVSLGNQLIGDPNTDKETRSTVNTIVDNIKSQASSKLAKLSASMSKQRDKDEKDLRKIMQTAILGGRGGQKAFGTPINKVAGIMDGLDTIKGIHEGEFKGTQQIAAELGSIIAQVLSPGGGTTESDRKNLTPESLGGTIDDTIQYISGNPQDAISKDLLKQLEHMLERERKFWNERLKENNSQLYFMARPILERKDSKGRFLNKDLARDWEDLVSVLGERGEFDKPNTRKTLQIMSKPKTTRVTADMSIQDMLNTLPEE